MEKALDLFCGAGGVAVGLQRAGYAVTGIDHVNQPDYPGEFILGDALCPPVRLEEYRIIWASPPCQKFVNMKAEWKDRHDDLIPDVREMLAGHPKTVIENVPYAPIRRDLVLTQAMFGRGRYPPRRRHFELSFWVPQPPDVRSRPTHGVQTLCLAGRGNPTGTYEARLELGMSATPTIEEIEEAIGLYHIRSGGIEARRYRLHQAIPKEYAEYIGLAARSPETEWGRIMTQARLSG